MPSDFMFRLGLSKTVHRAPDPDDHPVKCLRNYSRYAAAPQNRPRARVFQRLASEIALTWVKLTGYGNRPDSVDPDLDLW